MRIAANKAYCRVCRSALLTRKSLIPMRTSAKSVPRRPHDNYKNKKMLSGVEPRKNFIELLKELELSMHNVMFFIALFTGVYVYGIPSLNQHLIKYTPIHNIFLSLKKYLNTVPTQFCFISQFCFSIFEP